MTVQTLVDFTSITNYDVPATNNQYVVMSNFSRDIEYSVTLPASSDCTGFVITFLLNEPSFNTTRATLSVYTSGSDTIDGIAGYDNLFNGNGQTNYTLTNIGFSWFQVYCDGTQWISNNPQSY